MNAQETSTDEHPLLALLPVAAGAVTLRTLKTHDVEDFLAYRSDPAVARYQGWRPMGREAALAFLQVAVPTPWSVGEWTQIGIATTEDSRLVGDIGLLCEGPSQVQLGFSLAGSFQGRGWAYSAVEACIDKLLVPLGIQRLRSIADERNSPSRRLLARLKFVEQVRERVIVNDETCIDITFERHL